MLQYKSLKMEGTKKSLKFEHFSMIYTLWIRTNETHFHLIHQANGACFCMF